MYISNRKHGFRIIREYKSMDRITLQDRYGTIFDTPVSGLEKFGYRRVKEKPITFNRL